MKNKKWMGMGMGKGMAAAAGMVAVMAGMAMAGDGPVGPTKDVAAFGDGVLSKEGKSEINIDVEGRAILFVMPATNDGYVDFLTKPGAVTALVDDKASPERVVGNVAHILVQTNFEGWDVVVRRKHEGLMLNQDYTLTGNEAAAELANVGGYTIAGGPITNPAYIDANCPDDYNMLCYSISPTIIGPPTNVPGIQGVALRARRNATGALEQVKVEVAVGIVKHDMTYTSTNNTPQKLVELFGSPILTRPDANSRKQSNAAPSVLLTFGGGQKLASFAEVLGPAYRTKINADWDAITTHVLTAAGAFQSTITPSADFGLEYFGVKRLPTLATGDILIDNSGTPGVGSIYIPGITTGQTASTSFDAAGTPDLVTVANGIPNTGFPAITDGYILNLETHNYFKDVGKYTSVPGGVDDYTMVFYVNAKLDLAAGDKITANRNGRYMEELTFTFVAQY